MRRSIGLVLFALVLPLVLAACGDTNSTVNPSMSDSPMGGIGHGEDSPVAAGARRITVVATSFEFMPKEITVAARSGALNVRRISSVGM